MSDAALQPRPLQMGAKGAYIVRLLMVGDSSCGKTSLVLRFDQNVFSTKFVTTIGVDYRDKMITIEDAPMRLQLWDTAGQERFRSLTSNFFGRADGFVLCFSQVLLLMISSRSMKTARSSRLKRLQSFTTWWPRHYMPPNEPDPILALLLHS